MLIPVFSSTITWQFLGSRLFHFIYYNLSTWLRGRCSPVWEFEPGCVVMNVYHYHSTTTTQSIVCNMFRIVALLSKDHDTQKQSSSFLVDELNAYYRANLIAQN